MTDHKTVREALEFYANQKAYRNRNPILDEFDPEACIHGAIHDDKGKRATEALAALDRIEATQPPQTTDAQRQAAMRTFDGGFDSYEKREYADNGPDTGKAEGQLYFFWPEQVQQIKSALRSPAVPREVVESIAKWQDPNRMTAIARKFTKEITRNFYSVRPHDSDMIEENIRRAMEELIGEGRQDPMPISEALALLGGKEG